MKSDLVDIDAKIKVRKIYETVDAYLVDHGGRANVWLPKSVAEFYSEAGNEHGVITLPQSWAIEKDMV